HFKNFNDEHGHACGDFVPTEVADLFKELIRDVDRISRLGDVSR
ncbi:MAG: GGDEF domain-containing protein, partial [Candidatus Azotimanducaceae bacterium]